MPETAAQKRKRALHDAVVAGIARRESPGEDAAVEKVVAPAQTSASKPSEPATSAPQHEFHTGTTASAKVRRRLDAEDAATSGGGTPRPVKLPKVKPTAKVYQRHVVFALVAAFLIKLVSEGKSLPRA